MRLRRIRVRKEYRVRFWLFIFIISALCFIFIPRSNRDMMVSFFSTRCRNYQQVYSRRLTDRVPDYIASARAAGIERCSDENDLGRRVASGELFRVSSSRRYMVEEMTHSYPYLTRDSRKLLKEIGKRFSDKVTGDGLKGSRFIITSMTRTSEMIKRLGQTNVNASDNSPHLNGNAFDISYTRFHIRKLTVTECDKWYMKEALAEVIWELRKENKCWATYEKQQGCFHVVSR